MTTYRIAINSQSFAHAVINVHAESPEQAEVIASERLKDQVFFGDIDWDEADAQISIDAVYQVEDEGRK